MYHANLDIRPYTASGDLSACYLRAVSQLAADFKVDIAGAGGGIGILVNKPKSGEGASVAVGGECEVRAGVALTAGDFVTSAASGWIIPVSSSTNQSQLGQVKVGCASGMIGVVNLNPVKAPTA